MANNYSSDPKNLSSINNAATPQSGQGSDTPGNSPSYPESSPSLLQSTPGASSAPSSGGQRRLASNMELSGGRYKIDRLVASGGMGAVYRAIDTRFNRPCAVKEMLDDFRNEAERAQSVEWFSREATLLLELNHTCIPRVRDFFMEQGKHYLVMDFIDGRTLAEVLERDGNVVGVNGVKGLPEARVRSWAMQVCNVLAYLHRQTPPIIFRDLKPSNIMVTDRDEVKLIDFGIARTFQTQRQSTIIMTVGYAPQEQISGNAEPRSDIYALGATLHKLLTRHDATNNKPTLFDFPPVRMLRPDVSPAFEQVLRKSLMMYPTQRYTAVEMEDALRQLPPITSIQPTVFANIPASPLANPLTPNSIVPRPISGQQQASVQPTMGTTGPAGMHIVNATNHIAAGRFQTAYPVINQANALEPNNPLVHKLYGQYFAHISPPQPDLAIRAYNRSLELYGEDAETHKLVGDVFFFLRRQPQQAIPAYKRSLELNIKDAEAHQRLGQSYEQVGQLDAAIVEYQEAAKLAKQLPVQQQLAIHNALGLLAMRINRLPVAEQAFIQVLFLNNADYQTRFLLCQVYERENKLEEAYTQCGYVIGPLANNPAVGQMYKNLRTRLGR